MGEDKDDSSLIFYDEKSLLRAGLVVLQDGPALRLLDKNGKVIWSAIK